MPHATAHFKAHGQVCVTLAPGLSLSRVSGPWNRELVKEWMTAFTHLAPAMAQLGPHAGVAEITGSALATADALALMRNAVAYGAARHRLRVCAIVAASGVEGQPLVGAMFAQVFDGLVPFRPFSTMEQAQAWCLHTLGQAVPA